MPYSESGVGHQNTDTSAAAARDIESRAATLRSLVASLLLDTPGGLDSEQIAERLGQDYGSIQPRTSELRRDGVIVDTGVRHLGRYGKQIIVWAHREHHTPAERVLDPYGLGLEEL